MSLFTIVCSTDKLGLTPMLLKPASGSLIYKDDYTDKKENKIFLIYKEIHKGFGAKSYMTNGLLIYG
jgi:hypothetical protein